MSFRACLKSLHACGSNDLFFGSGPLAPDNVVLKFFTAPPTWFFRNSANAGTDRRFNSVSRRTVPALA